MGKEWQEPQITPLQRTHLQQRQMQGSANGVPLMREACAMPKKIAAGQHRVKSTGYHLLNESMQYAVSVQLA